MAMNVNDWFAAQRYNDVIFPQNNRAPGRPPKDPGMKPHKKDYGHHDKDWGHYDSKPDRVGKAENTQTKPLSSAAQKLLDEMKRTYTNVDFDVAGSNEGEEAQAKLSSSTKKYSVLFTNDEIERMATDEKYKNEMLGKMHEGFRRSATESFRIKSSIKGGLERNDLECTGVVYNSNGTSSVYSRMMEMPRYERNVPPKQAHFRHRNGHK